MFFTSRVCVINYSGANGNTNLVNVLKTGGGTCHVCMWGCACHVFGCEITLESHILGLQFANMNFSFRGGGGEG